MNSSAIVQRLWNYCTVLRDDGLSYGDYVEQLTYLLFLKMDDERRKLGDPSTIPDAYAWQEEDFYDTYDVGVRTVQLGVHYLF